MHKQLCCLALWVLTWTGVSASSPAMDIFRSSLTQDKHVQIQLPEIKDEVPICQTEYRWANFHQAETIDGKKVNLTKGYGTGIQVQKQAQWFYIAYCSRDGESCSYVDVNTESMCKTQYGVTVAMVETNTGEASFAEIQIPTACVCVAKVVQKKRSENLHDPSLEEFFLNKFK